MQDIYDGMKSFMTGMKVTGAYLKDSNVNEKATVTTIDYDGSLSMAKQVKVADRFRGHLHNDAEKCITCDACAKACPIDCFYIDGERTETNKIRPSRFDIDLLKCMYCGLCVFACPTGSLTMTREWWGATFAKEGGNNLHGHLRSFGMGYYTPEQKIEVERKRAEAAEARKKAAAVAQAAKAAAEAQRKAAESADKSAAIPNVILPRSSGMLAAVSDSEPGLGAAKDS